MTFAHPNILWLLLVFPPALAGFFWWAARRRQQLVTQFIEARLLPKLVVGISRHRQMFRAGCVILAVIGLILALARPQWGFELQEVRHRGLDIVVAIDTSKSMLAEDIAPNRLSRAKLAALDLMQQARADRLGLVAFAGDAFLQCPLTFDDAAFRQSVEALDVNIIPQGGTAIAAAINTALTAFKEADTYKTLVLFTDGEDQDSGALEAAKAASDAGLHIFTIGIGTTEGELLRIRDGKGRTDYIRDSQENVVKSHLNEELLRQISGAAQGFYLPLRGAKTIDTLYEKGLSPLPKTEGEEKLLKTYHERYRWPLAVAILLLIVEMLMPERKRESKRERKTRAPAGSPDLTQMAAGLMLLAITVQPLHGSPSSALREYQAGRYDQAFREYQELLKRKTDDPRLHYNAGAAAYRQKQFDQAATQFNEALNSPDLNLQELAYYNRGNSFYHLGEVNPDPQKRTESWEKAIRDYESSLKLNPQDTDAKWNHEFVKKKLEELKQQQQQQKKSDQNKDQNKKDQNQDQQQQSGQQQQKDQKDQPNQSDQQQKQNSQGHQDQQKKDSGQQPQQAQNQDQQQKDSQQKEQQAEAKQQQQNGREKEQEQKQQQAKQAAGQPGDEQKEGQPGATAPGEMTQEQAQQLLDTVRNSEKMLSPNQNAKAKDRPRPLKDW